MNNNDILRRLRFALRIDDDDLLKMLNHARGSAPPSAAHTAVAARARGNKETAAAPTISVRSRRWQQHDLPALLARSDDADFRLCPDAALESFLDALIEQQRGPRDPAHAKSSAAPANGTDKDPSALRNNEILKKLRIAFAMRDDAMRQCLRDGGVDISKSELSALFRQPDHRNYQRCGDQVIRACLQGLTLQLRPELQGQNSADERHTPQSRGKGKERSGSTGHGTSSERPSTSNQRMSGTRGRNPGKDRDSAKDRSPAWDRNSTQHSSTAKDRSPPRGRGSVQDRSSTRGRSSAQDRSSTENRSLTQNRRSTGTSSATNDRNPPRDRKPSGNQRPAPGGGSASNHRAVSERASTSSRSAPETRGPATRTGSAKKRSAADTRAAARTAVEDDSGAVKTPLPWQQATRNRDAARRKNDARSDRGQDTDVSDKPGTKPKPGSDRGSGS